MAAIYQYGTDNYRESLTITCSVKTGTADSDYPASNLVDGKLWTPAKATIAAGECSFLFNFGSAKRVDLVALANLASCTGFTAKWQGHTSDSWTTPDVDLDLTLPTTDEDGQRVCPWLDVAAAKPTASDRTKQYWRLKFAASSGTMAVGEVWISATKRTLSTRSYRPGFTTTDDFSPIVHETEYGIRHVYERRVRARTWEGTIPMDSATLTALRSTFRGARRGVKPFLWIPDSAVNDAWWVTWAKEFAVKSEFAELHEVDLEFREEIRGEPV